MADGIMLGKGTVRIKVLPGALRVIAPEVGTGVEKPQQQRSGLARTRCAGGGE